MVYGQKYSKRQRREVRGVTSDQAEIARLQAMTDLRQALDALRRIPLTDAQFREFCEALAKNSPRFRVVGAVTRSVIKEED